MVNIQTYFNVRKLSVFSKLGQIYRQIINKFWEEQSTKFHLNPFKTDVTVRMSIKENNDLEMIQVLANVLLQSAQKTALIIVG